MIHTSHRRATPIRSHRHHSQSGLIARRVLSSFIDIKGESARNRICIQEDGEIAKERDIRRTRQTNGTCVIDTYLHITRPHCTLSHQHRSRKPDQHQHQNQHQNRRRKKTSGKRHQWQHSNHTKRYKTRRDRFTVVHSRLSTFSLSSLLKDERIARSQNAIERLQLPSNRLKPPESSRKEQFYPVLSTITQHGTHFTLVQSKIRQDIRIASTS